MKPDFSYNFVKKIEKYIEENNMIRHGDLVLVGLSGGADSVCLFLILNKLKQKLGITLHALHVNHGIRKEGASHDEEFSKALCEQLCVPCRVVHLDIPKIAKENGLTEEEAGRKKRYELFKSYAEEMISNKEIDCNSVRIAVAHHINDQAETVLFNMVRGSGLKGIGGMSPVNEEDSYTGDSSDISIIRPLLCVTRAEINEYLSAAGQNYCTDETNADNEYSRNLIRNEVIESLNKIQPKTSEHISMMAEDVRDAFGFIDGYVDNLYKKAVICSGEYFCEGAIFSIDTNAIMNENSYIVRELIIYILKHMIRTYKDITKKHICDVVGLIDKGRGKRVMLPYGIIAEKERGFVKLYFEKNNTNRGLKL